MGVDLLSNFRSADAAGAQPMGVTISGIRLSFNIDPVAAAPAQPAAARSLFLGLLCADRGSITGPDADPQVDLHMDWMWWERIFISGGTATLVDIGNGLSSVTREIKARRRCDEVGDSLIMFASTTTQAGVVQFAYASSVLLLLP